MKFSRTKFVILFLVFGFAFIFGTVGILRLPAESFFGSESQAAWQNIASTVVSPIKIVLIGPLLPAIEWLHRDPDTPPPFFLALFTAWWTLLAIAIHTLLTRMRRLTPAHKHG